MDEQYKRLCRVNSVKISLNDHGILLFHIDVDYEDGCSQRVGGIILDEPADYRNGDFTRIGCAYGSEMIRRLHLFFNAKYLGDVRDYMIYVIHDSESMLDSKVLGIQNLNLSGDNRLKSLMFSEIYDQFYPKDK